MRNDVSMGVSVHCTQSFLYHIKKLMKSLNLSNLLTLLVTIIKVRGVWF